MKTTKKMRAKKFDRKLSLNKETISNLTNDQLNSARGGTDYTKLIMQCNTRTLLCSCYGIC